MTTVAAIYHLPVNFTSRSGLVGLQEALGAHPVYYRDPFRQMARRSWRVSHACRKWATRYYGSQWNYLLPVVGEYGLARRVPRSVDIAHFFFAEFASPKHPSWFRTRAERLVGTYHASERRLPTVLKDCRTFMGYDAITLMSKTQRGFFEDQGFPAERIKVILHGVDTSYFCPAPREPRKPDVPLRGLMVGKTERDHTFMRTLLEKLPAGVLNMTILTSPDQRAYYYGGDVPHAVFPKNMSDTELLMAYQQADLLVMPMLDCTANNVVLESMACGTPVMVNKVGGISEYVDPTHNIIVEEHNVDVWLEHLTHWHARWDDLERLRSGVRTWALDFDWQKVARAYVAFYLEVLRR